MKRRKFDSKTKTMIVLQGLRGKAVSEICAEHQISQTQFYQWRDQFLANASKAFEVHQLSQLEDRLRRENDKLKRVVGELTLEVKKTEDELRELGLEP